VNFSEINGELVYGFQSGQKLYAAYLNKNEQKPMQEGVSATTTSVSLPTFAVAGYPARSAM
jgi:hypothetical protein